MTTRAKNQRLKTKNALLPKETAKSGASISRKSALKDSQQTDDSEEGETSSYFKQIDSDALDDSDVDVGKKKSKALAVKRNKTTSSSRKKRKIDEDQEEYDSDDQTNSRANQVDVLEEDSVDEGPKRKKKVSAPKKSQPARKKRKKQAEQSEDEFDAELEGGQEVVGVVVQAPKTGRVPPGQISQNTLNFLTKLKDPACNDRQWFKLHEPVYRLAEKEWNDFVESFTDVLADVDPEIPHLPTKDVIHRIYRDIDEIQQRQNPLQGQRFSKFFKDWTKGYICTLSYLTYAAPYVPSSVKPDNQSMIGGGSWCTGRSELANIRANILRDPRRLRKIISAPKFVKYFGKPEPHPKGEQQNIFGMENELKTAPKGIDKDHKDIDLLKCRDFAVAHRFTDSEVLAPDFKENIAKVAKVLQPFVHCLNDMMTVMPDDNDDEDQDENQDEDADEEGEDE